MGHLNLLRSFAYLMLQLFMVPTSFLNHYPSCHRYRGTKLGKPLCCISLSATKKPAWRGGYDVLRSLPVDARVEVCPRGADSAETDKSILNAALKAIQELQLGGFPYGDECVVVANDWHSALAPMFIHAERSADPSKWAATKTTLLCHNAVFQGRFQREEGLAEILGVPEHYVKSITFKMPLQVGKYNEKVDCVNTMAAGLRYTDRVLTVSPTYAMECSTDPEKGCELEDLFAMGKVTGILNGVKEGVSSADQNFVTKTMMTCGTFTAATATAAKAELKASYLAQNSLPTINGPLMCFIGRLDAQKGYDLLLEALIDVLEDTEMQIVIVGAGRADLVAQTKAMEKKFPGKFFYAGWMGSERYALLAGCDYTLMPSRWEPCGLVQMEAMRVGTCPIVAPTGGLKDTVEDGLNGLWTDSEMTVEAEIDEESVASIARVLRRAVKIFVGEPTKMAEMKKASMAAAAEFTWTNAAMQYEAVFEELGVKDVLTKGGDASVSLETDKQVVRQVAHHNRFVPGEARKLPMAASAACAAFGRFSLISWIRQLDLAMSKGASMYRSHVGKVGKLHKPALCRLLATRVEGMQNVFLQAPPVCHVLNPEPVGGVARFVTKMRDLKAESLARGEQEAVCLFSGDAFNPSLTSTTTYGRHMVPALNAIGIHTACYGNHDFDFGVDQLQEMAAATNFPWLISNVTDKATGRPLANGIVTRMMDYHGRKVGLIGLVEKEWLVTLATIDPDEVDYEDFCPCARRLARQLKENMGAEIVIALTHMRVPNDELLAHEVAEIDVILGGHDHHYDVKAVGPHGTYVLKSGTDFRDITELTLEFKDDAACPRPFEVVAHRHLEIDSSIPEDPEMKVFVDECMAKLGASMDEVIGYTAVDLDCRFSAIRTQETNIGNLVTDIMRKALKADLAVLNSGTLRADSILETGEIKVRDLVNMLPMLDECCLLQLQGSQVLDVLENAVSQYPRLEGRFLQVSGVSFNFDAAKPGGQRVVEGSAKIGGEPLVLDRSYKLCTK
ncbi:unnamed protein product, partial [Polarella glacialis]